MTISCTKHVSRQLLDRREDVCRQDLDRCMHVCRRCHSHHCFPSNFTPTVGRLQFHPCDVGGLIWTDCHCNSCEQSARQKALSYILVWKQALGKRQLRDDKSITAVDEAICTDALLNLAVRTALFDAFHLVLLILSGRGFPWSCLMKRMV